MVLPELPAGTTDSGTIRFPSRVNVQIRQSWSAGAPSVTIENTAVGRCSRNLDTFECPIDFLEVESTDARRAYLDADVQLDSPPFPRVTIRFRWRIGPAAPPVCVPTFAAAKAGIRTADPCGVISSITPGVASNSPSKPYAPTNSSEPLRAVIRGTNLPSSGSVEISGGIQVNSTTFVSSTQINVGLSDFRGKPEGPRDVIIKDSQGVQVAIGKGLFFVSSLEARMEVNQGVPMECTSNRPCLADHNTTIRVKLECNGVTATGDPCEKGKTPSKGLLYVTGPNGPIAGSPFSAPGVRVLPAGAPFPSDLPTRIDHFLGFSTMNFNFNSATGNQLITGRYDFSFVFDPRNVNRAPAASAGPGSGDLLTEEVKEKYFTESSQRMKVAALVDTTDAPANTPDKILGHFELLYGAYPASRGSITVDVVPATLTYPATAGGAGEEAMFAALRAWFSQNQSSVSPPYTHVVFFTASTSFGDNGLSECGETSYVGRLELFPHFTCNSKNVIVKLRGENTAGSVAHELGHTWKLGDTYNPPTVENPRVNPVLPACVTFSDGCPAEAGNLDTVRQHVSLPIPAGDRNQRDFVLRDFMGSADRAFRWVDLRSWNHLYPLFDPFAPTAQKSDPPRFADAPDQVIVRAVVEPDGSVKLLPFGRARGLERALEPTDDPDVPPGDYTIEIQTSSGQVLDSRTYQPISRFVHTGTARGSYVSELFDLQPGAEKFVIKKNGSEAAVRGISANVPFLQLFEPGSATPDGKINLEWSGSDPDGDTLTYSILFSRDGGATWTPLVAEITQTSFSWDTKLAPGSSDARLRVVASDGFHEAAATSQPVEVPAKAPFLTITRSGPGPNLLPGGWLSGAAYDWQDGELPGQAISFSSNRDGPLGPGPAIYADRLTTGQHRITASVTNSLGLKAETEVVVIVEPEGETPSGSEVVKITPLTARGWPNERNFNNPPANAVDGSTDTFTWTTNPNNTALPSYFGADFGASKPVSRIRLFKDNDGGGGTSSDFFKNLSIEYTTSPATTPLPERTFTRVTGLTNGYKSTELLAAVSVNSDGTVTRDSHNSSNGGWASLTFNAVNATGIRIAFSNVTSPTFFNHYKVHEFEAYGPSAEAGGGGGTPALQFSLNGTDAGGRVNFLSVNAGDTATVSLTVRNSGTADAAVNSITSSNSVFSANPQSFTLQPNATGTVNVRFAPTAAGAQQGVLTFNLAGGVTATLNLSGTGVAAPAVTGGVLQVDGGTFELATGFNQGGVQGYFVNRLTPASYPATLRKVVIYFPAAGPPLSGLPIGSALQIVSAAVSGGGDQITGVNLTRTNATVTASNTFVEYDVPALTLQSGQSFLVGFSVLNPPGVYPAAVDVATRSAARSYIANDGTTFFLYDSIPNIRHGNFAIRARVEYPGGGESGVGTNKLPLSTAAGWPNGRTSNNLPPNAIDGSLATFTWTTEAFASAIPSYLGIGFAGSSSVSRIRLYKDNDSGGAGPVAKNLIIEYTTSPTTTPLSQRTWTPVTGLINGFQGAELLQAAAVNSNGTVSADNHNSTTNGWASLTFNAVNATGIRIGFSNVTTLQQNHYRVYEIEAYGR